MIRLVSACGLVAAVAVSIGLYDLKYEVESLEDRRAELERSLSKEHEAIRVLKAEWSYLNQPDRLQDLTEKFLALGRPEPWQVADVDELPPRLATMENVPLAAFRMKMPPVKPVRGDVYYRPIALSESGERRGGR